MKDIIINLINYVTDEKWVLIGKEEDEEFFVKEVRALSTYPDWNKIAKLTIMRVEGKGIKLGRSVPYIDGPRWYWGFAASDCFYNKSGKIMKPHQPDWFKESFEGIVRF